jgi:hypothetical protein
MLWLDCYQPKINNVPTIAPDTGPAFDSPEMQGQLQLGLE